MSYSVACAVYANSLVICLLISQGMAAIMPAMVIVGLAKTIPILYTGLTLFAFGMILGF